jgi:CBS domain-containing protein
MYLVGHRLQWPIVVTAIVQYLGFINILLAVFNMIPAFPLDGGRVLRSFLWKRKGSLKEATAVASSIGSGFGTFLIVLGVMSILFGSFISGLWWFLIGMFLRNASKSSLARLEIKDALKGEPIKYFMSREPVTVPSDISIDDLVRNYIYRYHFHMFPVVRDGVVLGHIGTREVKRILPEDWAGHSVQEMLTPLGEENTVGPETEAMDVLSKLQRSENNRLLVMDDDRLVGVVSLKDILHFLSIKLDIEKSR